MQYPTITDPSLALEYKMKQGKGAKANRVFPREYTGHGKHSLPKTKETILQMDITKSVQFSCSVISDSLRAHELQHARLSCLSLTPGVCSQSCPLSQWCHPTISSSVVPFSSRLESFPASGSLPTRQFFTSGGQSTESSASASVLPMNIQNLFPLGLTGLISLSKKLWRVFSNTTVQKHQFFGAQFSLWSNSDIHTWLLK